MRPSDRRAGLPGFLPWLFLACGLWAGCRGAGSSAPGPGPSVAGASPGQLLTPLELQTEVQAFADRYIEALAEATDVAAARSGDEQTAEFNSVKVIYATAAVSIASLPDPVHALREFVVLIELQQWVWSGTGPRWATPEQQRIVVGALAGVEAELQELAERVMPPGALGTIRDLVRAWTESNPDRTYVSFVRFADLGDEDLRLRFAREVSARGLLAPVAEATRELQEIRAVSERALFVANHLPLLAEWQAEAFLFSALQRDEIRNVLEDARLMRTAVEGIAPRIGDELEDLGVLVARERADAMDEIVEVIEYVMARLLVELNAASETLGPVSRDLVQVTLNLRETVQLLGTMAGVGTPDAVRLTELRGFVASISELTRLAADLAGHLESLSDSGTAASALESLDRLFVEHERRVLLYGALLILFMGAVAIGVVEWARRRARPAPTTAGSREAPESRPSDASLSGKAS